MGVKNNVAIVKDEDKVFDEMKRRFLSFKKHKYLEHLEHFKTLAELQAPKSMPIKYPWISTRRSFCGAQRCKHRSAMGGMKSRGNVLYCPKLEVNSYGFVQASKLVISSICILLLIQNGPTETNAALEFAVNTLKVENILVIGHSSCAGIQSLMSMEDYATDSSFVHKWMVNAKVAKLKAKAAAAHLSFDQQCKHCEKESINLSLKNLMTYPWIEERLKQELLSVHGGYYDFLTCTFEKWTLDYKNSSRDDNDDHIHGCLIKDQSVWC